MNYQDCQQDRCLERASHYVDEKKLYVCSNHQLTHYSEFPFTVLIAPSVVKRRIEVLEEQLKEFIAVVENFNHGSLPEKYESLNYRVKEELQIVQEKFNKVIRVGQHFKYRSLFKEVEAVENLLLEDEEYISVIKTWSKGLTKARLEDQRSIELIKVELKQKYEARFEKLIGKIREQTRAVAQKHQQEINSLQDELEMKNEEINKLKHELEINLRMKETEINNMKTQLESKQRYIESSYSSIMDEIVNGKEVEIQDLIKLNQTRLEDLSNKNNYLQEKSKFLLENLKEIEHENSRITEGAKKAEWDFEEKIQSLISELNTSEYSYFSLLYKINTGEDTQIGPETDLILKLDNPKDMEFLTSLNKRMPDIDRLDLSNTPLNCQEVKTFLATYFPNEVRVLNFNNDSPLSNSLPFYLEELVEVSKRVAGGLYIYAFEVSQDQLVSLFSANRHKKWFGFSYSKLSLSSVPDFGGTLAGSTMQGLDLEGWGHSSYGDWGSNESHFENLIAGLSKEEDFRKNLDVIDMIKCGMEKNVVEKILEDHGFGHVEITNYSK